MQTPIDRALDAQFVRRWNLVATTAPNSVASHSFNVAMIAMALRKVMFNTIDISQSDVCFYAIIHDIDEVYTGDLPTPTKAAIREKGVEPNSLFVGQNVEKKPPDKIAKIIKMADLIDNYIFIRQYGVGDRANRAADEVGCRLNKAIRESDEDLKRAANYVLTYIEDRRSETDEERDRIEDARQTHHQINNLVSCCSILD